MNTQSYSDSNRFDLNASKICKAYKGVEVVKDFDISISSGDVIGLIGDNGTGKSTIMRILALIDGYDAGDITINGVKTSKDIKQFRSKIGYIPQSNALIEEMTALDNLKFFSTQKKNVTEKNIDKLSKAFDMDDFLHKRVKHLSGGMKRRVNIAAGLINSPRIIVADEPFAGLDAAQRKKVIAYLKALADDGVGQVITSHYAENLQSWSRKMITLN